MKKRFFLTALFVIAICMTLTACNFNFGCDTVVIKYHEDDIRKNIQDLADADGVKIVLAVTDDENTGSGMRPKMSSFDMIYAAKNNVYYFRDDKNEYYYDLTSPLSYTVFTHALEEDGWSRKLVLYTSSVTEEKARKELNDTTEAFFMLISQHISFEGNNMNLSTATVAERTCDKYFFSMKVLGVGVTYTTYVDQETGACLGIDCDVTAIANNVSVFGCTEFKTEFSPALPETYVDVDIDTELTDPTDETNNEEEKDEEGNEPNQEGSNQENEQETQPDKQGEDEENESQQLTPRRPFDKNGDDDEDETPSFQKDDLIPRKKP